MDRTVTGGGETQVVCTSRAQSLTRTVSEWSHQVVAIALCALLVSTSTAGVVTAGDTDRGPVETAETASLAAESLVLQVENNSSIVRHEDPSNTSRRGDLGQLESWLAGRMSQTLIDCTDGARAREWGACDLGEEYPEWLDKYVEVAGETETGRDDNSSDAFEEAREDQERFNDRTQAFYETYDEFREAREAGNTDRARELGRELQRLSGAVNQSGAALSNDFETISRNSDANLSRGQENVEAVRTNVSETTTEVESVLFVETALSVQSVDPRSSFLDPLVLTGRLTTANGSAIADRDVGFTVAGTSVETRTDSTGRFEFRYRPTTIPLDTEAVTVRFQPRNRSIYLPTEDMAPIALTQVRPNVTVRATPETVGFAETLTVRGAVAADGVVASGVPVVVSVDGSRLATVRTDSEGQYRASVRVPATVAAGEQSVETRLGLSGQALASVTNTTVVAVESTASELTVDGSQASPGELSVSGRLQSAGGVAVEGQRVVLFVEDEQVGTTQTGANGAYGSTVGVPAEAVPSQNATNVTVEAVYEGRGSSLEPTTASAAVTLVPAAPEESAGLNRPPAAEGSLLDRLLAWLFGEDGLGLGGTGSTASLAGVVFVVLVLAAVGISALRRRSGGEEDMVERPTAPDRATRDSVEAHSAPSFERLLERAREYSAGDQHREAILAAYGATRARFDDSSDPSQTHWEFYRSLAGTLDSELQRALRELTERYEGTRFGSVGQSRTTAAEALAAAVTLVQKDDDPDESRADGGRDTAGGPEG